MYLDTSVFVAIVGWFGGLVEWFWWGSSEAVTHGIGECSPLISATML